MRFCLNPALNIVFCGLRACLAVGFYDIIEKNFNGVCWLLNGLLSPARIVQYLLRAVVVLIAIPFHESAHALASHLLGDDTAVRAGRLSMNPMHHFDPLGALCMLVGGVGWAKPVSINPYNYKNPKLGMALSAAAGPASNFLLAWVSMILYKLCWYSGLGRRCLLC